MFHMIKRPEFSCGECLPSSAIPLLNPIEPPNVIIDAGVKLPNTHTVQKNSMQLIFHDEEGLDAAVP